MLIKCLPVGHLMTNCYIVTDETTLECAVIDPGEESNTILYYLEDNHLPCRAILLTHGHYDHTGAVYAVHEETGAPVYMNALDAGTAVAFDSYTFTPPEGTIIYKEGDEVKVGNLTYRVMETPGHTPGGVPLNCGDALFTGATLFAGSCGRTDFAGGSMEVELQSLAKIAALPGDYEVYPGHMDSSTLETERRFNPYLTEAAPYRGAYMAVVESVTKLVCAGFHHEDMYLTFQEYFEHMNNQPERWGKPMAALLGALDAQTRTQLQTELLKTWQEENKTCFFVTHDIEEAIVLASRVVIMSARPGRIKEIIDIDIPHPRDQATKMSPRFVELKNYIWSQVYQEYLEVQK